MASYKKIIENMIGREVEHFVEKKSGQWAYVKEDSMKLTLEEKQPFFRVDVKTNNHWYNVHGWVNDYGTVSVSSVTFERDYLINPDREDWDADDNIKHDRFFLYDDTLKDFRFDR